MKVLVLYRPNSEHSRMIEEYVQDFKSKYPDIKISTMGLDTREGMATASIYDVVRYPAILVLGVDGLMQNVWQGDQLPLRDEVAGYARS